MKKMKGEFVFLGTGGSMGVPIVGCTCSVCVSNDEYNKRLRSSGLITIEDKKILIDCGTDFRIQALRENLSKLDGMILTHAHYDHIGGLDDLRALFMSNKTSIPCLLSKETSGDIKRRFDYMFKKNDSTHAIIPNIQLHEFPSDRGVFNFLGMKLKYLSYHQLDMAVNGVICGDLAYLSDIKHYPDTIFEDLKDVETLIVSALRFTSSAMHFTVDEAIDFSKKTNAKRTYLTHIAHELEHKKANAYLPSNIQMAYDGLKLTFHPEIDYGY